MLADLKTVFGDAAQMTTTAILAALHTMPEAAWNDLKGKPINDRGLATRLRNYGVKPKVIRVGEATPRGYSKQDFHDVWLAYLPPLAPDGSATSATDGEKPSLFNAEGVADADEVKRNSPATSATSTANVADTVAGVADDVADKRKKNASEVNDVSDVADVALPPEANGHCCAHCGQLTSERWKWQGQWVLLHNKCADAWTSVYDANHPRRNRASSQ